MGFSVRLAAQSINPDDELAGFRSGIDEAGALVTFLGIARPEGSNGSALEALYLDHHPHLTEASLRDIGADVAARFGVTSLHIVHRCGQVMPGDTIVFVAAAAVHRRAAFEAADYAMDRLKTDAFFWKREDTVDGSRWIEPTANDHADLARWSK